MKYRLEKIHLSLFPYSFIVASLLAFTANVQSAIVYLSITGSWTAANYDVSSTGTGGAIEIPEEDDNLVFGTAPSDGSTTFTLRVDTSSAVSFATGYNGITHDWYGYSDVTLLGTHTFGSASWKTADILTGLVGVDNLTKALWTDTDIALADPTRLSFRMFGDWVGNTADLFIGTNRTITTIGTKFLLWEYFGGEEIRSGTYSAEALLVLPALAQSTITVNVKIENLAPDEGTHLTPFWIGFHDGTFDVFTAGESASGALESLAEDGNNGPLTDDFDEAGGVSSQATITGPGDPPVFFPGDTRSMSFVLDRNSQDSRYISFASMIIPSNDAFIGNSDPKAYAIFDEEGNFVPMRITIWGTQVWDAGTEVNDEVPANVAFLAQAAPNTGVTEGQTVQIHAGFEAGGEILSAFPGADFTAEGYRIARLTITQVPSRPINVEVTFENPAPDQGTHLTPIWFGFHDGTFNVFDSGEFASEALESLAEDGDSGLLAGDFAESTSGQVDTTLTGPGDPPVYFPGDVSTMRFTLDGGSPFNRYFSYATMIIPSNDAFVGNGDPNAIEIFDEEGSFLGADIVVMGNQVWDAGTEFNNERPKNTAFLGQMIPNTGVRESRPIQLHSGFNPGDDILTAFPGADFTADGYEVLRITVVEIPPDRQNVKVEVENLAPENGNFLTPVWVGFHDGGFDFFDIGEGASPGLESLAEDGATATIGEEFLDIGAGHVDGTIISDGAIPPFAPSDAGAMTFTLDAASPGSRYLSYASMVIPSNDAFVANGDPHTLEVFDEAGNFSGFDVVVPGSDVWDAGTEVNDEVPANTAFLEQAAPNTGDAEVGTVQPHVGFAEGGSILSSYPAADFMAPGYDVLQLTVSEVSRRPVGVDVTIENLSPDNGTYLTPVWIGFHNGGFDIFNEGETASLGLESLSEDGATGLIGNEFLVSGAGTVHATITSGGDVPPFAPGQSNTLFFVLDGASPDNRYLSYASMVIPSNDAFVANGGPTALPIFDDSGNLIEGEMIVMGSSVWDAGTEVNDELPANTAFFGQGAPDTGVDENGTVTLHTGFMASGAGGILDDTMFSGADFTAAGYQVLRITVLYSKEGGPPSDPFGGVPLGGEWYFSEWYGIYNSTFYPWIFHAQHGWQYIFVTETEGEYFIYDLESEDFWWTTSAFQPLTFYSFNRGTFNFYFVGTSNPRSFVDLQTG